MNSTKKIETGTRGTTKIGCNVIEVEMVRTLYKGYLVKNVKTGKVFSTPKFTPNSDPAETPPGDEVANPALPGTPTTEAGMNATETEPTSEPAEAAEGADGDDGNGGETENAGDDIPAGDEAPNDDEQDEAPDDDEQENPAPESHSGYTVPASTPKTAVPPPAPAKPTIKKASTLDEAIKHLRESGEAKSCPELILALTELGLCSLKGATPAQTLYSSFIREIKDRGSKARIMRSPDSKGKFKATSPEGGPNA